MHTKRRGIILVQKKNIDNPRSQSFIIKVRSDSNYATNPETRKIISGMEVTLTDTPVVMRSEGQFFFAFSVTEA